MMPKPIDLPFDFGQHLQNPPPSSQSNSAAAAVHNDFEFAFTIAIPFMGEHVIAEIACIFVVH